MPDTVIKLPQLGESIAEGTIGRWLKQPGDQVQRDEPLVEVQTDKVNAEVPSPVAGVLRRILQPEGTTVAVNTEIAVIGDGSGDGGSDGAAAASAPAASERQAPAERPAPAFTYDNTSAGGGVVSSAAVEAEAAPAASAAEAQPAAAPARQASVSPSPAADGPAGEGTRRFYTPVVLRMAREHHLDLEAIHGSGLGGRVTRKDVERVLAAGPVGAAAPTPAAPVAATAPALPQPLAAPTTAVAGDQPQPLTPMRRAIAHHMVESRSTIPDAWCLAEVDVTKLVRLRAALLPEWQAREGFELTFLPFMLKAVLAGLRAVPALNATWLGEQNGVVFHRSYHLGVAVSVDNGLVVPVLKDADQYSVAGLAKRLRELVLKARGGKLSPDDLQGATFTVNNPGALGSIMSQPIIPVGQSAIVTMEAIVKRPVVVTDAEGGDSLAIRSMMNLCLSFDHRVMDGAQALQFLKVLRQELEAAAFSLY